MDRVCRDAQMQVRRAGDQRHLAGFCHTETDHTDERIRAALHHWNAGGEVEMIGSIPGELIDDVAGPDDHGRPLLLEVCEVQFVEQRPRQAAVAAW